MIGLSLYMFQKESSYVLERMKNHEGQHQGIRNVASNFDFLTSKFTRPHRICWLGTLTPDQQFTNENVKNLKQFTVLLQSALAPSVLVTDWGWQTPRVDENQTTSQQPMDAEIYLLFIPNNDILALARRMFGDDLVVEPNGYAFVTKSKKL